MDPTPYLQVAQDGDALFKDRASKFYAYAFPCAGMEELDQKLVDLKKLHPTARHFCWASRMGHPLEERANDAGEPAHSAGTPILHALQSIHVEQSAVVVVRYFGGTKLGVPGLIAAYRSAAEMALEVAGQIEVHPMISGKLTVPYDLIGTAELHLRQCEAQILEQTFGDDCSFHFTLKWAEKSNLEGRLHALHQAALNWLTT
jgi:uncharacterized YigZ family protein